MKKVFIVIFIISIFGVGAWYSNINNASQIRFSDVEAEFEDLNDPGFLDDTKNTQSDTNIISSTQLPNTRSSRWAFYWKEFSLEEKNIYQNVRPVPGPKRVGIQAGHWKNNEVPEELSGLKRSGGGATGGGKTEVDIVLNISRQVKTLLEAEGVIVDLLPTTIPVDYFADAFVSIHADGNNNPQVSGFKIAYPQRDFSLLSTSLVNALYKNYEKETGLDKDSNITRRMSAYYAFNWRRYEHALHPMTPAAIVETGFITSPTDRNIIVNNQEKVAKGIAKGILEFLNSR